MEHFDPGQLRKKLHALPDWKRVTFMAACCERMLPNYVSFSSETYFGDAQTLKQALSEVWRWIETNHLPDDIDSLVRECDRQAPDTADFSSIYTSAALDAANSIAMTLEAMSDATEDRAIEVASIARDTVDLFVQQWSDLDPNSPGLEKLIIEAPLMQVELRRQRRCLEQLKELPDERDQVVTEIRASFSDRSLPPTP
ncbi:MAG TPA: hypothetical protein DDZ76_08485 [Xanthomonadales bacterium]|nr:hypothetical protein [Xanthomonadales bacterium]